MQIPNTCTSNINLYIKYVKSRHFLSAAFTKATIPFLKGYNKYNLQVSSYTVVHFSSCIRHRHVVFILCICILLCLSLWASFLDISLCILWVSVPISSFLEMRKFKKKTKKKRKKKECKTLRKWLKIETILLQVFFLIRLGILINDF